MHILNNTWTQGPIKALPKIEQPIHVIKKQSLVTEFPRSDSVRSNVSAYPILQNGGLKVVRHLRSNAAGYDTSRSNLKGM